MINLRGFSALSKFGRCVSFLLLLISLSFFNPSILSAFLQTFGGVSLSQTSNAPFTEAIVESVSETLKVPREAVTGVSIIENRRMLLSSVTVSYTLHIISGMTSDYFVNEMEASIASGTFLSTITAKSAIQISSVYDLRFLDYSPTANPTNSPIQSLSKSGEDSASFNENLFSRLHCFSVLISIVRYLLYSSKWCNTALRYSTLLLPCISQYSTLLHRFQPYYSCRGGWWCGWNNFTGCYNCFHLLLWWLSPWF